MLVAVTGAAGFIGSNVCKRLEFRGHEVIRLVRPALDNKLSLSNQLQGADAICHCAWAGHPRQEVDITRNITTSTLVAMSADTAKVGHMVFMSSGGGRKGNTEYAIGKHGVEGLYSKTSGLFNFDLTVLRPTAVFGHGQDLSRGIGAVDTFLNAVKTGKPVHILGSPHSARDFLHVGDLADCVVEVIEQRVLGTFEVGGPEVVELCRLIQMIETALAKSAVIQIENPTGTDPQIVELDNSLITSATGWAPKTYIENWLNSEEE